MRKFMLKYHLEVYSVITAIIILLGVITVYELSDTRKIVLLIMGIGVFHEWEEKRWPGGFFEALGKVWGWDMETVDLRAPGQWVVYAWFVIVGVPLIFDHVIGLVLAPIFLGIFEAIVHTAGGKLAKLKGPYYPGVVTAWVMGIASVFGIVTLCKKYPVSGIDCLTGVIFMMAVLGGLQFLVQKSAGSSIRTMMKHMRNQGK